MTSHLHFTNLSKLKNLTLFTPISDEHWLNSSSHLAIVWETRNLKYKYASFERIEVRLKFHSNMTSYSKHTYAIFLAPPPHVLLILLCIHLTYFFLFSFKPENMYFAATHFHGHHNTSGLIIHVC